MLKKHRVLLPLLLLIFLDSFGYFLVIPVLIRLIYNPSTGLLPLATLAERNILMGISIGVGFLAMIIAAPYVGRYSDKYGRKKIFLTCLLISLLGFVLPIIGIVKKTISLIIMGRFVAGVGSASQPVAQATVADIAEGKEKALFLSLIAFSMTLALLLGPLVGSYLSDANLFYWVNNGTPYWIGSGIVILNIILLGFWFNETISKSSMLQEMRFSKILLGIVPIIRQYKIGHLMLSMFLLELGWSQYYNAIMLILAQKYQYTTEQASNFSSYLGLLMCIGLLVLYPILIRYFDLKKILTYGIGLVAFGLLGCTFFSGVWAQWLFVIPVTIFTGISYVGLLFVMSNQVSIDKQGWIMGYAMTALALAWFITSFITGWLLNINLNLPLVVATFVLMVTTVVNYRSHS